MSVCKNCGAKNLQRSRYCKKCKISLLSKNKIPSTLIVKNEKKYVPDTVITTVSKKKVIKKDIPNTVIATRKPKEVPPTLLMKKKASKQEHSIKSLDEQDDIFSKYNNLVTPIFNDKKNNDNVTCSKCNTENIPLCTECNNCGNKLKNNTKNVDTITIVNTTKQEAFSISQKNNIIGRDQGDILFPDSSYISQKHTKIYHHQDKVILEDLGSMNGTYLKLRKPYLLKDKDIFSIGKQIFQFRLVAKVEKSIVPDRKTGAFSLANAMPQAKLVYFIEQGGYDITILQSTIILGRDVGNIVFINDNTLSSQHVSISLSQNGYILQDMNSKSGTWIRITKPSIIKNGDMFRVGEHIFLLKRC